MLKYASYASYPKHLPQIYLRIRWYYTKTFVLFDYNPNSLPPEKVLAPKTLSHAHSHIDVRFTAMFERACLLFSVWHVRTADTHRPSDNNLVLGHGQGVRFAAFSGADTS